MEFPDKESLEKRFDQYTDDQLMEVLRDRKNYQDRAVEAAVEVAMRRKLINSRQDLFASGFNQAKPSPRKIFPLLNSSEQTGKMLSSLFRIVYLISLVPLIFAVMNFAEGATLQIISWATGALLWAVITWRLEKKREARLVFLLVALFFCFHIIYFSSVRYTFKAGAMDLIIYILSVLVIFYMLCYLYILLQRRNKATGSFKR